MAKNIDRIISECLHRVLTEDMNNISQGIINSLRKGYLDDRYYNIWQDIEDDEKLYYLWESEFSGLCHLETFIECGELLVPMEKERLLVFIDDELYNKIEGYDVEDSNHYVIKYSNGQMLFTSDYEGIRYPKRGIKWISPNGGLTVNGYYAINRGAENDLLEETEMCRVINGEIQGIDFNYDTFRRGQNDWV